MHMFLDGKRTRQEKVGRLKLSDWLIAIKMDALSDQV